MNGRWRWWVIPLVILLCIGALWFPLPCRYEETTFARASSAVIHLSSAPAVSSSPQRNKAQPSTPVQRPFPSPQNLPVPVQPLRQTLQTSPAEEYAIAPKADISAPSIQELASLLPDLPQTHPEPETKESESQKTAEDVQEAPSDAPGETDTPADTAANLPQIEAEQMVPVGYKEMDSDTIAPKFNTGELSKRIVYPPTAKRQRITGEALLLLYISANGHVDEAEIVEDSGYGFGMAARDAFLGLEGIPAMRNGVPIAVKIRYPIHFSLR
jgi:TonB family protein